MPAECDEAEHMGEGFEGRSGTFRLFLVAGPPWGYADTNLYLTFLDRSPSHVVLMKEDESKVMIFKRKISLATNFIRIEIS